MAGVLLTPGPVTTHMSVKRLSRIFNTAVTKNKFMTAARQLQTAGLGSLMEIKTNLHCFIKRPPSSEVIDILLSPEYCDLNTGVDYARRYDLPVSAVVTDRIKSILVLQGLVPQEAFKERNSSAVE